MHCTGCGTLIPDGARFCLGCGAPVAASESAVAQAVAQPGRLSDSGALELRNLLVSETTGDYEIHEEVGRGGMAVVYRATEIHLSRQVAIKVLPPELTFGKGAIERFRREAKTAAALDHPNIIPIYRITPGGRLFWYAMKFLEGRSLADVLAEKGLLTVQESIGVLDQVADALDYAHQRGVVHRDIKPGNVMLDARGRVIVTDFGIAKELQQGAALTGSGNILGTPYYMSPEQCRGTDLTGAADQYSLAVMAYQMISGQLPFEADSAIDLLHKHCVEPPPPIDSVLPGLPKHVINALNRGMAKKPGERYASVDAFVSALKGEDKDERTETLQLHRRASLTERLGQLATGSFKGKKRGRPWKLAAGIVVLAVAGTAGVTLLSSKTADQQTQANSPLQLAVDNTKAPVDSGAARSDSAVNTPPTVPQSVTQPPRTEPAPARPRTTPTSTTRRPAATAETTRTPARTPTAPAADTSKRAAAPTPAPVTNPPVTNPPAATPAPATPTTTPTRPAGRRGFLRVTIRGGYATIFVNGQRKAEASAWADSVPSGRFEVRIERPGFQTQRRTVTLRAGQAQTTSFTMRAATP